MPLVGAVPYGLLGVVSGYMYEDSDLTLRISTDYEAILHANSGISIVVPAEQLKALVSSPALQQLRDEAIAKATPKKSSQRRSITSLRTPPSPKNTVETNEPSLASLPFQGKHFHSEKIRPDQNFHV